MIAERMNGQIIKAVGGLYTVETSDGVFGCKARGIFRKQDISPCTGDRVTIENECITEILPRKNVLIRPPLANLDRLFFVLSTTEPAPNLQILDKFLAVCVHKEIEPILVFTKVDLADAQEYMDIYRGTGFRMMLVDYENADSVAQVRDALADGISAFTGNSGVGKSTLLNAIENGLCLETAAISKKLGRGRHTTRTTELYTLANGGKVADTPGFSTFETESYAQIRPDLLPDCFPEFKEFLGDCKYADCRHMREPDCAIREAVRAGSIPKSRYLSYRVMLDEALARKDWEQK